MQEYSIWFFSFPVLRLFYFGCEPCFFPERIMLFFTNERELVTMGSEYLRMIGISYLLSAIAQVCMTIMKNCGAIRLSTVISSVTVILNIMLNGIFIFGLFGMPAMKIWGAAVATVIATAVQMAWSTFFVTYK